MLDATKRSIDALGLHIAWSATPSLGSCGPIVSVLFRDVQGAVHARPGAHRLRCRRCLREEEHREHDARSEHAGNDHREAIEILLHNARGSARVIQRAGDHVGYTGALARMHEHKRNEASVDAAHTMKSRIWNGPMGHSSNKLGNAR